MLKAPASESEFDRQARALFKFQYRRNRDYRRLCELEGKTPDSVRNWRQIPAMPTAGFKEFILTTFPAKRAVKIFRTSGTTQGTRGVHFFGSLWLYKAASMPVFERYLLPDKAKLNYFFLTASPKELPDSSLSYMMGLVNERFAGGGGKYYVRRGQVDARALVRDLRRSRASVLLLATAFSLKLFLDHLHAGKLRLALPDGSRIMETGGFKGRVTAVSKRALYEEAQRRLGIRADHIVSEYGMTELTSQFYDTTLYDRVHGIKRKPFKTGPARTRTLVIDPATGRESKKGQRGFLRHFDLANVGSVMAVQTEDIGRVSGGGFEVLGRAPGADLRGCSLSYEKLLGL